MVNKYKVSSNKNSLFFEFLFLDKHSIYKNQMHRNEYTEINKTQKWWYQRRFRIIFISSAVVITFIISLSILLKFTIHEQNQLKTTNITTTSLTSTVTTTSLTSIVTTTSSASPTTTTERRSKL